MTDHLGYQGKQQDDGDDFTASTTQSRVRPRTVLELEGRRKELQTKIAELDGKIMTALDHNYEGYKKDTDQQGKPFYGANSHREFERDRTILQRLRDELSDVKESLRDEQASIQSSAERAMGIIRRVYNEEVGFVPKALVGDVQKRFQEGLRTIDWTQPQLRQDMATEGMVKMIFAYAANEARKTRKEGRTPEGQSGSDQIDGEHTEGSDAGAKAQANRYGHEEGSVAWKISQQYEKLRSGNNSVLGDQDKK